MERVQAVTSDEIFQEWLAKADMKTLKKFFEKRRVKFSKDHVSAVETVYDVSKFMVISFEKKMPDDLINNQKTKTEKVTMDRIERYRLYDFQNRRVDYDSWKEKHTSVPTLSSLQSVDCQKCYGSGKLKCSTCGGSAVLKCSKCNGSGRIQCNTCKGSKSLVVTLSVYDSENRKEKKDIRIPCPACAFTGIIPCTKCNGSKMLYCRNCEGGYNTCSECKGYGKLFIFKYEPVPFQKQKRQTVVFYKRDVEKFIQKKDVEKVLNTRDVEGIAIYNIEELVKAKLEPKLNYWTPEADKVCNQAKKEYKNLLKKKKAKVNQKIMVYPALQLRCKSVKGKKFELFGIGIAGNFIVLDKGFS